MGGNGFPQRCVLSRCITDDSMAAAAASTDVASVMIAFSVPLSCQPLSMLPVFIW